MVHFKIDSENVFCLKMSHLAKSYKKKVVFTNFRNFKIFFRQIKISCCLQNISKFHIGQINHAWLRAFWKKKFQKFQKLGKKNFPHKIPQGPPQAGPLCLGVFPSCHNTFHQIWSNSSFLPFPPLLYRLSEFTLKQKFDVFIITKPLKDDPTRGIQTYQSPRFECQYKTNGPHCVVKHPEDVTCDDSF